MTGICSNDEREGAGKLFAISARAFGYAQHLGIVQPEHELDSKHNKASLRGAT